MRFPITKMALRVPHKTTFPESQTHPIPLEESSDSNSNILNFSQSNIRTSHVWTTSKEHTLSRTTAMKIVHVARRPIRAVRGIVNSLLLLEHFMTNQILEEIVKCTLKFW